MIVPRARPETPSRCPGALPLLPVKYFRRVVVDPDRRQPHAEQRPHPDPAHRALDEHVEGGVAHEGGPVGHEEDEQPRPAALAQALAAPPALEDPVDPGAVDEDPQQKPGDARAGEHGEVTVMRAADRAVLLDLEAVVVGEVDAEALAGPEI